MGCYDTIIFRCPNCGAEMGAQSKSGDCLLMNYSNAAVPIEVAYDANRHAPFECECGKFWVLDTSEVKGVEPITVNLPVIESSCED